ncbi:HDOD domain-containing protein [Dactylosporangium sp. NBC_01737]|uniref:EAL and HDOD domain-containing protein n=1 Tax=Dactylosporangium sp. NBC_01737 TaxID=2975959 RepID=UPI002E160DDB|nr:HDOD domain-containing protein [Dactylosporangium sp. NBC_01737]
MSQETGGPDGDHVVHVGRQPIYDRDGAVVAHELLFRAGATASTASRRDAHATARVLVAAFTEFGLDEVAGGRVCFINLTRDFLIGQLPLPFDCSQAVLEVLETTDVDEEVLAGVTALHEQGYTIALDDFVFGTSHERLLDVATYVKIDMLDADEAAIRATVVNCRLYSHLQLIAERLETPQALDLAMSLGFEFFQGHVLGRPHVSSTVALAPSRLTRLRIMAALSGDDVDIDELIELVGQDAGLSLRLLRATNAASFGLNRTVSSIRDAVVALGLARLRQWVTLMLVADITEADPEQLSRLLIRARCCQLLAEAAGLPGEPAYIGGLLSAVADLFDEPADRILNGVPLDKTLTDALVTGNGPLGQVLAAVRAYTAPGVVPDPDVPPPAPATDDPAALASLYLTAVRWANATLSELSGELRHREPDRVAQGQ